MSVSFEAFSNWRRIILASASGRFELPSSIFLLLQISDGLILQYLEKYKHRMNELEAFNMVTSQYLRNGFVCSCWSIAEQC